MDFYTRVLRFEVRTDHREAAETYVALQRDGVVLGLSPRTGAVHAECRRPPSGVELVFEVDDLEHEYAATEQEEGIVRSEIVRQPWGLRDFRLTDPDGYYIRLTEREVT